jgi:tripartite-type tricarboxylate transporter receptor subunit TctC
MAWIRCLAVLALTVALVVGVTGDALAQSYPSKPIKMIVPFPSGGISDVLARIIAPKLTEGLGQPVVVENRPGAGTTIAADMVAKSAPDGYTIYLTDLTTHAISASLYKKLSYDPLKDFTPITTLTSTPLILVVHPSVKATSVKELIAVAKSKPGQLNLAHSGNGTITHLAGQLFKSTAGVDMVHIPYTGSAPATTAILAGEASALFSTVPAAMSHVKAGKLRALAVTTAKRSPLVPDVPTVAEAGLSGYEVVLWSGILAPPGLPKEITTKLNAEFQKVLQSADVKERFAGVSAEPSGSSSERLAAHIKAEIEKYAKLIKDAGVKIE